MFLHGAFYQNCTNGSTQTNEDAARALDKNCLLMAFPTEPLVLIEKKITELILIIPFT